MQLITDCERGRVKSSLGKAELLVCFFLFCLQNNPYNACLRRICRFFSKKLTKDFL